MNDVMRPLITTLLLVGLVVYTPAAMAQGMGMEDDGFQETTAVDEALDLYWAQKREIRAIHSRMFLKEARHEFTLVSGIVPNDEFFTYYPVGARWNYYFNEDFSSEMYGSYTIQKNSDLKNFLESRFRQAMLVDIPQSLQWVAGAAVLWSPVHGKVALFTSKLAHFDIHMALGAGAIGTKIAKFNLTENKIDVSGNVGLGFRFYLSDWLSVRLDYRQFFYAANVGGVAHPVELTLGVSFWTQGLR